MNKHQQSNCHACGSRNPTNATQCLSCNAPLSFARHLANQDKVTRFNPVTVLVVLIIMAAIAYAFRDDLGNIPINRNTKKVVCVSHHETHKLAEYESQGYQRCDILEKDRCPFSTDRCLTKTFERPTPESDN